MPRMALVRPAAVCDVHRRGPVGVSGVRLGGAMSNVANVRGEWFSQLGRYTVVALVAVAANVGSRFGFRLFMGFEASVAAGYFLGGVVNFCLSRTLVFAARGGAGVPVQAARFCLVAVVGLGVNVGAASLSLPLFGAFVHGQLAETAAHLAGIGTGFVFNFIGHKYFSFAPKTCESVRAAR